MTQLKESTFAYARLFAAERIADEIEWILSDAIYDEIYSKEDAEVLANNLYKVISQVKKLKAK